jgi:hypothetical protein
MKTTLLATMLLALLAACEGAPGGRPPQSPLDVDDRTRPSCVYDHTCGAP